MRHTLLEQSIIISSYDKTVDEVTAVFTEQFGYIQRGDYYFSPIDTKFGVRLYISGTAFNIAVTFDGGENEKLWLSICNEMTSSSIVRTMIKSMAYHVSKNGNVIYLRFDYYTNYTSSNVGSNEHILDAIISVDESGKTVCFRGLYHNSNSSTSSANKYLTDSTHDGIVYDSVLTARYNVRPNEHSAIYKLPSITTACLHKELYGIVSVQSFDTQSNGFINFDGQIYHVVSCQDINVNSSITLYPYFAFPVAD